METKDENKAEMVPKQNVIKLLNMAADTGTCRSCGKKIWRLRMKTGRVHPVTDEGISHFADCPNASQHRIRDSGSKQGWTRESHLHK